MSAWDLKFEAFQELGTWNWGFSLSVFPSLPSVPTVTATTTAAAATTTTLPRTIFTRARFIHRQ